MGKWRLAGGRAGPGGLGGVRRRLLLLAGLGAAAAAEAVRAPARALAAGYVVGAPPGYSPLDAPADGVQGYAAAASVAGVFGRNNVLNGVGVHGTAPAGTGVYGESTSGTALAARSASGMAVFGLSTSNNGVQGQSASGNGLWGEATGTGVGVMGRNMANGHAVWGESTAGIGVVGRNMTNGHGLWGESTIGSAVVGWNPTGSAGWFNGSVLVNGALTVTGAKSAAVPHPDGSLRRMYCLESPESYFEEVGRGQLANGRGQVRLDADFAPLVRADEYEIFLTPRGDCLGLYIAAQTSTGFEVRELQGGTSTLAFSYRVVAQRRDIAAQRLERVVAPAPTRPTPPAGPPDPKELDTPAALPARTP